MAVDSSAKYVNALGAKRYVLDGRMYCDDLLATNPPALNSAGRVLVGGLDEYHNKSYFDSSRSSGILKGIPNLFDASGSNGEWSISNSHIGTDDVPEGISDWTRRLWVKENSIISYHGTASRTQLVNPNPRLFGHQDANLGNPVNGDVLVVYSLRKLKQEIMLFGLKEMGEVEFGSGHNLRFDEGSDTSVADVSYNIGTTAPNTEVSPSAFNAIHTADNSDLNWDLEKPFMFAVLYRGGHTDGDYTIEFYSSAFTGPPEVRTTTPTIGSGEQYKQIQSFQSGDADINAAAIFVFDGTAPTDWPEACKSMASEWNAGEFFLYPAWRELIAPTWMHSGRDDDLEDTFAGLLSDGELGVEVEVFSDPVTGLTTSTTIESFLTAPNFGGKENIEFKINSDPWRNHPALWSDSPADTPYPPAAIVNGDVIGIRTVFNGWGSQSKSYSLITPQKINNWDIIQTTMPWEYGSVFDADKLPLPDYGGDAFMQALFAQGLFDKSGSPPTIIESSVTANSITVDLTWLENPEQHDGHERCLMMALPMNIVPSVADLRGVINPITEIAAGGEYQVQALTDGVADYTGIVFTGLSSGTEYLITALCVSDVLFEGYTIDPAHPIVVPYLTSGNKRYTRISTSV